MIWKIILIFFLIIIMGLAFCSYLKKEKEEAQVCFNDRCFLVELALTPEEKSRGLMYRENLPKDRGMLFIYEKEGIHSFWMKNVLIPLDIIWLDKDKKVVYIAENFQPCSGDPCPIIKPDNPAKYVFEINGGLVYEIGLFAGDQLEFETISLK